MVDVINSVIEKQEQEHLNDSELATKLGLNRVSWNRIKRRKTPFGKKFLKAVNRIYPDIFLPPNVSISNIGDNPAPPQSFISKIFHAGRKP